MSDAATTDQSYSAVVSYAHEDNTGGWVPHLVAALRAESAQIGPRSDRIFFNPDAIESWPQWKTSNRSPIWQAPVMLACVSQPYFASDVCRWDFQEHASRPRRSQDTSGIVPIFLEAAPEPADPQQALAHLREAVDITRWLAGNQPDSELAQRDLSVSLDGAAMLLEVTDPGTARAYYRESLAIRRLLLAGNPNNFEALWGVGSTASRIASTLPQQESV